MPYAVKELFYTLQGEGAQAGSPAVFCRFAGCNLWTGREEDRHKAVCKFCDTQFVGTDGLNGGKFATPAELAKRAGEIWDGGDPIRTAVRTARPPDPPGGLHRGRTPPPARQGDGRCLPRRRIPGGGRDQRDPGRSPRDRLDLRQPQVECSSSAHERE